MEKKKILVADDEQRIVSLISDFLTAAGYETVPAYDGEEALKRFDDSVALAVIDIMMPEINGWDVVREIRKTSNVPVIMLSARSEDFDMLTAFENGADEYVTKPFSPAVLVRRIEALIKRGSGETEKAGLEINAAAYEASVDGKKLDLTAKEFELLRHLYENRGLVLSRDALLEAVWGYDYDGDSRTVDSHVARLRAKLKDYGASHLKTVYGFGYKLE